jgi:hypothetical protein
VREIQDQFFFAFSEAFSCFFSEDFDFLSFAIEDTPPSRGGIYLLLISLDIYFVLQEPSDLKIRNEWVIIIAIWPEPSRDRAGGRGSVMRPS